MTGITSRQASVMTSRGGELQTRHDATFAWKTAVSLIRNLPGLRAAWTMGSYDENGDQYDFSGQGRTLNYNSGTYVYDGLVPTISFFAAANHYLNRADEAGLDILGTETYITATQRGLTLGGWFRFDRLTSNELLIGKTDGTVAGAAYLLRFRGDVANDPITFSVSDGAALDIVSLTLSTAPATGTWTFVVGRYDPSTEIKIYASQDAQELQSNTNLVGIPAALNNSGVDFTIGADSTGANLLSGDVSLCFLCATLLSDTQVLSIWHHTRALYGH